MLRQLGHELLRFLVSQEADTTSRFPQHAHLRSPPQPLPLIHAPAQNDAYEALKVLQAHRRIDSLRVLAMGFSRGADAALYASLRRMKDLLAPNSQGFAAHVAFYPNCGTHYRRDTETTGVPIRLFNGTADDFAPIAACRAYVDRLRASGADVALNAYEGAHAVFMWSSLTKPEVLESAQTTRSCELTERDDGTAVNAKTGMAFSHKDTCVQKGGTVGYDRRRPRMHASA